MVDVESGRGTHSSDGRPLGPDGRPLPGPAQMQQIMAQKRMAQQQAQVDEVVGIMRNNVEKVLERDQKLNELDEKADALQDGASQFEKSAGKLKNKFWIENMKMIIIGGLIGMIILGLIYWKFYSTPEPYYPPHGPGSGPSGRGYSSGEGSSPDTGHTPVTDTKHEPEEKQEEND